MTIPDKINEQAAAAAFTTQSGVFDSIYAGNTIIHYKRRRVQEHVKQFLQPSSSILELNAGTGEDAIEFAKNGYSVHATDIAAGMLARLNDKVRQHGLQQYVSHELCSFTELETLGKKGPYDYIFSNFAGLNCTNEPRKVLDSFSFLLKPGGFATLVLLPKFCLWEFLLLFRGKMHTAFRRFTGKQGAPAHIEGQYFHCWYHNPSLIRKHLQYSFDVRSLEGLCCLVPPSYIEHFAERYPRLYRFLEKKENKWKDKWPWTVTGDYFIITLQKKW